jgi:hypothetical protein
MCRNLTLEEKKAKLISNSFHNIDDSIRNGAQLLRENYENFREQLLALMEYFDGQKVYIVNSPVNLITHPENRRRLVDPVLTGTPNQKTLSMNSVAFSSFYELTTKISEHLNNNEEVFIYVIQFNITYDPMNFDPIIRPIIRYGTINTDYWYDPSYSEPVPTVIEPERFFERYGRNNQVTKEENKSNSIGDSKLIHKF